MARGCQAVSTSGDISHRIAENIAAFQEPRYFEYIGEALLAGVYIYRMTLFLGSGCMHIANGLP